MATNQNRQAQALGLLSQAPPATSTLALSAAATWLAYGFVPEAAKTLSAVRAYLSAVNGSPATTDITCALYSDSSGAPNASLESHSITSVPAAGGGWGDWAGFTTALTAGTQYWLVFANGNASPATNFPTYRWLNNVLPAIYGSGSKYGWFKQHSTNSGGAWGTTVAPAGGWRLAYADGTYDGSPFSTSGSSADQVYAARESGVKFTTPPNAVVNVRGLAFGLASNNGSPTGGVWFRLYNGTTLLATTNTIASGNVNAQGWYESCFSAAQVIQPGTVLRATFGDAGGGDSSSNYYRGTELTIDSDAHSLALMPFEGTAQKTYLNSTWTDTTTGIFPFALLLDVTGEFGASGGLGGGAMTGGFNA
jgi:hypothetical protein